MQLKMRNQYLEQENKKWMRLAGLNRLTGLPNSLMFYDVALTKALKKGVTQTVALACILISPDGLGMVNLKHGRLAGDQLIVQIGDFLKQQLEGNEQLFHVDGANFAILMPDATEGFARRKTLQIKNDYREHMFTIAKQTFQNLTVSMGIAAIESSVPEEELSGYVEQLYQDLSRDLYESKVKNEHTVDIESILE